MAQNTADMKVNTARSGVTASIAKAAGGVAGGFALKSMLPKENNFNIGAMPAFYGAPGANQFFNINNSALGNP